MKEKDLLNIDGFATCSLYKDDIDVTDAGSESEAQASSVDDSISDTLSDTVTEEVAAEDSLSEGAPVEAEEKPEWHRRTLISSLIETKSNLREIVDNASQKGAKAWKNLVRKSSKRYQRRRTESEPTSPPSDIDFAMSFDLEITCNTCGKKIIESRQRVMDGGLRDQTMDTMECLMCSKAREQSGSPEKWTLRYPKVFRPRSKTETNPETGESLNADADDVVDAPNYFVINGEDVDNRKTLLGSIETTYGVSRTYVITLFLFPAHSC